MSEIVFNSPTSTPSLQSQVESLQTTLASLNQQIIFLQEAIQEKDQKIAELTASRASPCEPRVDDTLTIAGALINLYKFAFPARKTE